MKILNATKEYSKEISKLMLSDLKNSSTLFPQEMILKFKEHAKEENIIKEFENPELISFLAIEKNIVVGFIVGYLEDSNTSMLHYITAKKEKVKEALLMRFINECKIKNINRIIADTFEFMNNNTFFKSHNFILTKKEKIINNLEMLWYELKLK